MTPPEAAQRKQHINDERKVHCPVDGCEETPLARGVYLHVMRSDGDGHAPQGDVPPDVDLENLRTAGTRAVAMDYPEHRDTEGVARLCPYCERPYQGKHGVLIHLGQVKGRKNHPKVLPEDLDPEEFPIVQVDEFDNVIEVVEEGEIMPSTQKRRDEESDDLPEKVEQFIAELKADGKAEDAARAEELLSD